MSDIIFNGLTFGFWFSLCLFFFFLVFTALVAYFKRDNSIANFTWGSVCALLAFLTIFPASPRSLVITSLIWLWALRMNTHLAIRYTGKDLRFTKWHLDLSFLSLMKSFGYVFFLQLVLLLIMSFPIVFVNISTRTFSIPLNWLDFLAICTWFIGFTFESVSDYQLYNFMRNPANKDKIMDQGLWRYSRHPNYFGEVVMWWSIYVIALQVPYSFVTIIAPVTITILLLFVTGIPWTEKALSANPRFQEYKKRTSIFFPWFSKSPD